MAETVKKDMKAKMSSRERGKYRDKKTLLEKLRLDKQENLGDTDDELMSEEDLTAADPDKQWSMLETVDAQLTKLGVDPESALTDAAIAEGTEATVAAAESKKRLAETEVEEAKQVAAQKAAKEEEERQRAAFTASTLDEHSKRMVNDPTYRAQMLEILAQHTKQTVPAQNLQEHLSNCEEPGPILQTSHSQLANELLTVPIAIATSERGSGEFPQRIIAGSSDSRDASVQLSKETPALHDQINQMTELLKRLEEQFESLANYSDPRNRWDLQVEPKLTHSVIEQKWHLPYCCAANASNVARV